MNANEAKEQRERQNRADRKEKEVVREFYATKEKQVLLDEGIMAEKRERKISGRILSNLKVNHFSGIKAGFRIATLYACLCMCVSSLIWFVCAHKHFCV